MSMAPLGELLLLPPANCLVAACAGVALGPRRSGRVLLWLGLGGLLLFSVPLVSGALIVSLEGGLPTRPDPHDPPGAIVILSGDVDETAPGPRGAYAIGRLTLEREREGARLARATALPVLVTGGVIRSGAPSLAALMAASLRDDFAVATRWQEDRAQDTWQNAVLSAAMLRPAGIGSVYLVTHAWHMRRALLAFRAAGLHATAAPVDPDRLPSIEWRTLVPRASSWQQGYYAAHEWVGCLWYWLRG